MKLFFQILAEFGLPVAAALIMGFFIYLIIKYILESVVGQVKTMHAIITMLDNRVKTMNHDMIKLDLLISHSLNLKPDEDRISRADGKNDARRDYAKCLDNGFIKSIWICNNCCSWYGLVYIFYIQICDNRN